MIEARQHDDQVRIGRTWVLEGEAPTADDGTVELLAEVQCQVRTERGGEVLLTCACSVGGGGTTWEVEASATLTGALAPGIALYEVVGALTNGRIVTLVEGRLTVLGYVTAWSP
ncbi:MAG: hypothetical protein ACRDD1_09725 [Planctomycetia bacterium]